MIVSSDDEIPIRKRSKKHKSRAASGTSSAASGSSSTLIPSRSGTTGTSTSSSSGPVNNGYNRGNSKSNSSNSDDGPWPHDKFEDFEPNGSYKPFKRTVLINPNFVPRSESSRASVHSRLSSSVNSNAISTTMVFSFWF